METQSAPSKTMAYLALIVGALLFLLGIGTLCSYLGVAITLRDVLSAQLGQSAALYLGLVIGSLALYHGWNSIRQRASSTLKPAPMYLFWIVFALALGMGNLVLEFNIAKNFLFPFLFLLGAALPTLGVLSWALRRLGMPITWRQGALALASGSTLSIVLTLFLAIFIGIGLYLIAPLTRALGLSSTGDLMTRFVLSPALVLFLIVVALQAPLPEEFSKALSAVLFGRQRITNERQAFAIGLLCGAGFAILENMLYQGIYATRGGWSWGGITLLRAIGSVLHPLCTAIVALGWFRMRGHGATSLLKAYAVAVGLHTLWNGGFIAFMYVTGFGAVTSRATVDLYGMPVQFALVGFLVLLSLGLWALLYEFTRRLAGNIAPEIAPTIVSRRALAAFAFACVVALVPIGAVLGAWWK